MQNLFFSTAKPRNFHAIVFVVSEVKICSDKKPIFLENTLPLASTSGASFFNYSKSVNTINLNY